MKNVSREVIYALPIPLPPAPEQERIVAKVEELMAVCDRLEERLRETHEQRERLLEAMLSWALREAKDQHDDLQISCGG